MLLERFVYEIENLRSFLSLSLMLKDLLICECQVRALFDDNGKRVDEAGPSIPVQVCR